MLNIGCHLSAAKGFKHMGNQALSIGANTFQFFTRNPRGSRAKPMNVEDAQALVAIARDNHFAPLLAHAPYTLNPCSADTKVREFAEMVMSDDMVIMEYLPNNYYTFHPGSHTGQGVEVGIGYIVDLLNQIIKPEQTTTILLETMSGKGSEIGSSFEEIKLIMKQVNLKDKIGVCLDTCHVFCAGYDIINDLDNVLASFDKVIGLANLKAVHLNDSMAPYDSHKDRHARIGEGTLGLEGIARIIKHPLLKHLPFYLETPNEVAGYAEEIKVLRKVFSHD
jgi:deoxyribonuclease-4